MLGQSVLMITGLALGPLCRNQWHGPGFFVGGWFLCVAGAVFGIAGAITLGRNRTMFPKPRENGTLIRHGIYGWVRHPLYTSVMLLAFGWGLLWRSGPSLLAAVALVFFFDAKARREERCLRDRFADYAAYQKQVRRFIPWLY